LVKRSVRKPSRARTASRTASWAAWSSSSCTPPSTSMQSGRGSRRSRGGSLGTGLRGGSGRRRRGACGVRPRGRLRRGWACGGPDARRRTRRRGRRDRRCGCGDGGAAARRRCSVSVHSVSTLPSWGGAVGEARRGGQPLQPSPPGEGRSRSDRGGEPLDDPERVGWEGRFPTRFAFGEPPSPGGEG
jgi:hypothetical protein